MNALLWICFTLSGAAALALEMLWMRSAGLVLGQTATTTATVLACYFGGLGIGAAGARGIRRRALLVYGWLEVGAAVAAAWSVGVFRFLATDGAQRWLAAGGPIARMAAVGLAVVPATICLGATLPVLGQALVMKESVGLWGGFLYALNTLGGVAGIVAAGFGLPAAIGVTASYGVAAATSALVGVVALWIGGQHVESEATIPIAAITDAPTVSRSRLRMVALGAGALALALEVLWTRLFAQVLHNSVYSFSAVALVFLVAIAAGAAASALLLRRASPLTIASVSLIGASLATIAGVWLFLERTDGLSYLGMQTGLGQYIAHIVALAAMSAGPAAFASGLVLPALWGAWEGNDGAARPLGDLSAANTFGCIAGAIVAAFVALPLLGLRDSLIAIAVAYIVLADILVVHTGRWRPLAYVALFLVVIANPIRAPLVHLLPERESLRAITEGSAGIVTVVETDGDLQMRLDNYYVLGGTAAAANERRLGLIPLLLHPAPHRVAFIGLATGITASASPALGVEETTVAELVPEVVQQARSYFGAWNGRLLDRPDVRIVLGDGRRHLAATEELFDGIVSDLFIPWHAGAGNLYSREMYETASRRLAPGGLFCQWLPLYQLTREEFDIITHTFLAVFPRVGLWRADFFPNRPVLGLVGQHDPPRANLDQISERVHRLPDWARDPLLSSQRGFVMLYVGDARAVADLFQRAPFNTDDQPVIEFLAPRLTRTSAAGDKDWLIRDALATLYDTLDQRLEAVADPMFDDSSWVRDGRHAGSALFNYALAKTRGDAARATELEAKVRALVPEVIVAAESKEPVGTPEAARRELIRLETEQETLQRQLEAMQRRLDGITTTKEKQ